MIFGAYTGVKRKQYGDVLFAGKQPNAPVETKRSVARIGMEKRTVEKMPDKQAVGKIGTQVGVFPGGHIQPQGQFGLRKGFHHRLKTLDNRVRGCALAASRQAQEKEADDEADKTG